MSSYYISFIRNYIYKISFLWAIKKHKRVSKKILYSKYFESVPDGRKENFSVLKTNKDILNYGQNNLNNGSKSTNEENEPLQARPYRESEKNNKQKEKYCIKNRPKIK